MLFHKLRLPTWHGAVHRESGDLDSAYDPDEPASTSGAAAELEELVVGKIYRRAPACMHIGLGTFLLNPPGILFPSGAASAGHGELFATVSRIATIVSGCIGLKRGAPDMEECHCAACGGRDRRVDNVSDFGVFVEIVPGVKGLVHVSELRQGYIEDVRAEWTAGDRMDVKLLKV